MKMRRTTLVAALLAAIAGLSVVTAMPASAQIYGPQACNGSEMDIVRGAAYQCFSWDGVQGGSRYGSYLLVNDWYNRVDAGEYHLTVSWYDTLTGRWDPVPVEPWRSSGQPTTDSILYSVTFNS